MSGIRPRLLMRLHVTCAVLLFILLPAVVAFQLSTAPLLTPVVFAHGGGDDDDDDNCSNGNDDDDDDDDDGGNGDCECSGRVSNLTLQYNASVPAQIRVEQHNGDIVFDDSVSPGGQFSFNGTDHGTLGSKIKIYVNGQFHVEIHTSCSQPIGPGLIRGDFEVIDGCSKNGGPLCRILNCTSSDPTNEPSCFKTFSDGTLETLLEGNGTHSFDLPVVCGMEVDTPDTARHILCGSGDSSSPCNKLKRDSLATIFNIRRSILFGDGLLGDDPLVCFGLDDFRIVLRCGNVHVPGAGGGDAVVTEETTLSEFVALANELCELADCPSRWWKPCGRTIKKLASKFYSINKSRSGEGDCPLCDDDNTPPDITCPTGTLTFECEGPDGAPIDYDVSATDDCDPNPQVTCFPPRGTVLPCGTRTTTVDCTAKDTKHNSSSCWFKVQVVDTTPPTITCPDDITVDCGSGNGATVNYPDPMATDLCDTDVDVVCTPPSGSHFDFGTTVVTCTATDNKGNTAQCTFRVNVVEDAPLTLTCPANITVECTSPAGAVVEYPLPMLSDTCDTPPTPTCNPPSGSVFPIGMTTVTCSAGGAECTFKVTVVDTQPPSIVCPHNLSIECTSPSGTPVNFQVHAEDTCDPDPEVVCVPPSGSNFPVGVTWVTCTATDDAGNEDECDFKVTVTDRTPPDITCPQDFTVACDQGAGAVVNYPPPMVSDNCDDDVTVVCTPPSGSVLPVGSTCITCVATDDAGNSADCEFCVTVTDVGPPELACVDDIRVECTSPNGAIVNYPLPVVSGTCSPDPTITCTPASGSQFPIGMTVVTCTATDGPSGPILAECTFKVTVEDTTPPNVVCPADIIVECETLQGTEVNFSVTATDTCDPDPAIVCNPPSGTVFAPGSTMVECCATDAAGNQSCCTFTVNVVDTRPPIISCPANITVECESPAGTPVSFTVGAIDACDAPVETLVCTPASGSVFAPGMTTVTCRATDDSGNSSECDFKITVVDTTPPEITCSQDCVVIECDQSNGGTIQYPTPTATDLCDPDPQVTCDPPAGTVLPLGTHTVTCTATDGSGNMAQCNFEVKVVDTAPPELVCLQDMTLECTGPDGAVVTYSDPTATDTCDPAPNLVCLPASGSVFPLGCTVVTCTADDQSGNMVQCTFKITVVDTTPPVLQCPGDMTLMCTSPDGTPVSFDVTATDVCDPEPVVTCTPPSGSQFPIGMTMVMCSAVDNAGNMSQCSFKVMVVDNTPPQIVCSPDFERECVENGGSVVTYPAPNVVDDCDPNPTVVCDPPSGTFLLLGCHTITCTATDAFGNEASCEFTVCVVDTTPPELVCPSNMTVECESPDGTVVDYPLPVANDACDGQPPVTCLPPSGSLFPLGDTEVVCSATDQSGNPVQCTFVISVVDTTPPDIICPEPITASCTSPDGAPVVFQAGATDICDLNPQLVCVPPSGSVFPLGQSSVTCTATDADGNESECTFDITVIDGPVGGGAGAGMNPSAPMITCPPDVTVECTSEGEQALKPPGWPPDNNRPPVRCSVVVTWPDPEVMDTCQTTPIQVTCDPPSGTRFELGEHKVTCRAIDMGGNEATCCFTIVVLRGERAFVRGDSNQDSNVDLADAIWTLLHLFRGLIASDCMDGADANDDGDVDMSDATYTLDYLFRAGPQPGLPFLPLCGLDPTLDDMTCREYRPCE